MKDSPLRILVVDDEDTIRLNLEAFLEDENCLVRSADNVADALKELASHPFDAGIIDIRLPDRDGNTLILEAHRMHPEMKFIIHTGSAGYTLPEPLAAIGITSKQVFVKPVGDMNLLIEAIRGFGGRG
ncbi:MAG: response regulator [Desulfobacterales bacterium]